MIFFQVHSSRVLFSSQGYGRYSCFGEYVRRGPGEQGKLGGRCGSEELTC